MSLSSFWVSFYPVLFWKCRCAPLVFCQIVYVSSAPAPSQYSPVILGDCSAFLVGLFRFWIFTCSHCGFVYLSGPLPWFDPCLPHLWHKLVYLLLLMKVLQIEHFSMCCISLKNPVGSGDGVGCDQSIWCEGDGGKNRIFNEGAWAHLN